MTRFSQSKKKTVRVADVLSNHSSSLGGLLKRASYLMQLEHLLAGLLDPAMSAHFRVADYRGKRLLLLTPTAAWATSLRMLAPQLVADLQRAGFADIERVDVRVAPVVDLPVTSRTRRSLSPAAKQAFEQMARLTDKHEK
jgi:hypothetical protein